MDPVTIKCDACGAETERPRHFRQKDYCSITCLNTAIEARDKRVKEAAEKRAAEAAPE